MYKDIIRFWFEEIPESSWWTKDAEFDRRLGERFGELHRAAAACELYHWRTSAEGRLAEVLVLDQFSRNIYRDSPRAFAGDSLALALAQEAIAQELDQQLDARQRSVLYLPFMHSESRQIHQWAVRLYQANGIQTNLDYELKHQAIIDRFGRYPHRNKILGRSSTAGELEFLSLPGSSF